MAKVFLLDVNEIDNINKYLSYVDGNRKNKIMSYKNIVDQKLSLGSGLLINYVLNNNSYKIENLKFNEKNIPFVNDHFFLSISHSGKYACVAISIHPIGVDIQENIGYLKNIENTFFSENDKKRIDNNIDEFYYVWCYKESYIKLFGYKDLKDIPLHIDYWYENSFCIDSHFGCVLTQDNGYTIQKIHLNEMGLNNEE